MRFVTVMLVVANGRVLRVLTIRSTVAFPLSLTNVRVTLPLWRVAVLILTLNISVTPVVRV